MSYLGGREMDLRCSPVDVGREMREDGTSGEPDTTKSHCRFHSEKDSRPVTRFPKQIRSVVVMNMTEVKCPSLFRHCTGSSVS